MPEKSYVLPDMGAVLGGEPHPLERETRRKELPAGEAYMREISEGSTLDKAQRKE